MTTDLAELVPTAVTDLADVLAQRGQVDEARSLLAEARELHLAKGSAALAASVEASSAGGTRKGRPPAQSPVTTDTRRLLGSPCAY